MVLYFCGMFAVDDIFSIQSEIEFQALSLAIFRKQAKDNPVYNRYLSYLNCNIAAVSSLEQIPFLPIRFFKEYDIVTGNRPIEKTFTSSGTTGSVTSRHLVADISVYYKSLAVSFKQFYGDLEDYTIFALLPSYLERKGSSLIDMVEYWMKISKQADNGFYLYNHEELYTNLKTHDAFGKKAILIGVSFALLDFVEKYSLELKNTIVMETGGMKGQKEEITREELHQILSKGLGTPHIHSEYGMTELLSQAYSKANSIFETPNWMRILIRETEDPFQFLSYGKSGGINIIDLANVHSCSFIATDDLGRAHSTKTFEVLGRFDHSDVRGCNLMLL